jgi:DNA-binding GntR family transcriptional regulator
MSPDDVREIYGLRAAIEGRAARMVAAAGDPDVIDRLGQGVDAIQEAVRGGESAVVFQADLAFHESLVGLAGNSRLQEVFARYVPTLRALLRLDEHVYRSLDGVALEHRPLLDALAAGDADRAASLAEAHCDHAGDLIADFIERSAEPAQ